MIIRNKVHEKHNQNINSSKNYSEIYQRKKSHKKTIHCPLAILDILNAIFVNNRQTIDYFLTNTNILVKTDYGSFKLPLPADDKTLTTFLSRVSIALSVDKCIFEKIILESSDLKSIFSKHCLDCHILGECKTMKIFIEDRP